MQPLSVKICTKERKGHKKCKASDPRKESLFGTKVVLPCGVYEVGHRLSASQLDCPLRESLNTQSFYYSCRMSRLLCLLPYQASPSPLLHAFFLSSAGVRLVDITKMTVTWYVEGPDRVYANVSQSLAFVVYLRSRLRKNKLSTEEVPDALRKDVCTITLPLPCVVLIGV
jgi:hypothetical protein